MTTTGAVPHQLLALEKALKATMVDASHLTDSERAIYISDYVRDYVSGEWTTADSVAVIEWYDTNRSEFHPSDECWIEDSMLATIDHMAEACAEHYINHRE